MKGLELCRKFYEEYGAPMIHDNFSAIEGEITVGLFGSGSECFGYDDEVSQDHDFEPGFCIILPDEGVVDRRTAFLLERAYAKLPKSFNGFERSKINPVGGNRHGVIRAADFFTEKTGRADGLLTGDEWFSVPENFLAEATNGEIFRDDNGAFSAVRDYLSTYPKDVMLKKLAGHLLLAAQAGQYNYARCLAHGEYAAAQLAAIEFTDHAISAIFLMNNRYKPYYKWTFRALKDLPKLSSTYDSFQFLITTDNSAENAKKKIKTIENICLTIADALRNANLSKATCADLEKHAYSVNDSVSDATIRNRHVLSAV